MLRPQPTSRPSGRPQRGATLVEFAVIGPLFFALIVVICEGSLAMRDNLAVANVTNSAGRAASTFGSDIEADYQIIQEVRRAAAGIGTNRIISVVVFEATDLTTPVPVGCAGVGFNAGASSDSVVNPCSVYPQGVFSGSTQASDFSCTSGATTYWMAWCPSSRKTAISGTNGPPDYLGIYVKLRHNSVTGLLGADRVITRTAVFRLEPLSLNSG